MLLCCELPRIFLCSQRFFFIFCFCIFVSEHPGLDYVSFLSGACILPQFLQDILVFSHTPLDVCFKKWKYELPARHYELLDVFSL